jgi:hypothetical protein
VVLAGVAAGPYWALFVAAVLVISTIASMRVLEVETSLLVSTVSVLRLARLEKEIDELRSIRKDLVHRVRTLVDERTPAGLERLFDHDDFQEGC